MEAVPAVLVNVELFLHKILCGSELAKEVAGDVLEVHEARYVKWGSAALVFLDKALQDIILVKRLAAVSKGMDDVR